MPRFSATVRFEVERDLTVYGRDEDAAAEKAVEIVEGWANVRPQSVEVTDIEEEEA